MITRREFLAYASGAVVTSTSVRGGNVPAIKMSQYLGRTSCEWLACFCSVEPESSHAVDAVAAFGNAVVMTVVKDSLYQHIRHDHQRLRRLMQVAADRDPGIIRSILDLACVDGANQIDCYSLMSMFIESSEAVADSFLDAAATADPYSAAFFLEPLIDTGRAIPLALIERLVHEYEGLVAVTPSDDCYNDAQVLRDLLPEFGFLARAVLCADGNVSERTSLFDRLLRLQRLDDDTTLAFVPCLSRLGAVGADRLVGYAASNLFRTSELACEVLSDASEFPTAIFYRMATSHDAACRTAAYRTLCKCDHLPTGLSRHCERAIQDVDAGVRVWAAATLIRHFGSHQDAEAVLGWGVRRPENALRRWAMEGLSGMTDAVEAVDLNLAHLLRDTEEDVQLAALRRIRCLKIDSPAIVELVGEIWLGKVRADALVRCGAMEFLAEAGPAALPFAWQGLDGNHPRVHSQAIQLMGRLGPQAIEAAPALADYWHYGDSVDRESILCALGRMKAASQLLPLVAEVWESRDSELAPIAAGVMQLFSIQDRRTLWPLVKNALSCRHRDVQSAAACSVRYFGAAVLDELALIAASADPFGRLGAVLALRELGRDHSAARSTLDHARVDEDLAVRMAADAAYATFYGLAIQSPN